MKKPVPTITNTRSEKRQRFALSGRPAKRTWREPL
jgi:hypothetical protein